MALSRVHIEPIHCTWSGVALHRVHSLFYEDSWKKLAQFEGSCQWQKTWN